MNPFRALGLAGWAVVAVIAALLIAVVLRLATGPARRQAAEARAEAALAASRASSGAEATETVAAGAARDAATDRLTQENADAIDAAPGAHAPVDPALSRAAALSLCRRTAYRGSAQCVQLLGPVEPPAAGSRR